MVHLSDFHVDSRVQRQARALAERGDEVHCVCISPAAEFRVGCGSIVLHPVRCHKQHGGFRAYASSYARFFAGALRLVSALDRRHPFAFVEVHNMPDFLSLVALRPKLRGAPVALNVHDTFPELFATLFGLRPSHPLVRLVRVEERIGAAFADALLFVTDGARDLLAARGVRAGRTRVVMNTPDEKLFGPRREPATVPAVGPLRLVYHGGLATRFGVELLVRGVHGLGDRDAEVSLDVYGSDAEASMPIAALARELAPESVRVAGSPTPLEQIPARLAAAHVGVVPTLSDDFTELLLPVKLLEYVHMGLPVVAARLPGIERYFSDQEVSFFEPGSHASLTQAILDLRRDPDAARQRACRAGERLGAIEWPRQRERYLSLVDELVDGAGA